MQWGGKTVFGPAEASVSSPGTVGTHRTHRKPAGLCPDFSDELGGVGSGKSSPGS